MPTQPIKSGEAPMIYVVLCTPINHLLIEEVIMAKNENKLKTETLALHGGQEADPTTGARALPTTLKARSMRLIFLHSRNSVTFTPAL